MGWLREEHRNVHKRGSSRGCRHRTEGSSSGRREKAVADAKTLAIYAQDFSDSVERKMILVGSLCLNKLNVA